MSTDIFSFQIAVEAKDQATQVLDKTLSSVQALEKEIKSSSFATTMQSWTTNVSSLATALQGLSGAAQSPITTPITGLVNALQQQSVAYQALLPQIGQISTAIINQAGTYKILTNHVQELTEALVDLVTMQNFAANPPPIPPPEDKKKDKDKDEWSLKNISAFASSAHKILSDIPKDIKESYDKTALEIQDSFQRITSQTQTSLGGASVATNDYTKDILNLANTTGTSAETVGKLYATLAQSSIFLTDTDVKANAASIVILGDVYGVAGEQMASFISNTRSLGLDIGKTVETAAEASQKFKVPGIIENLPDILQQVDSLYSEFGDRVTGNSQEITDGLIKQAATISRAYNVTFKDALQKAQQSLNQFTKELDTTDDVMLGLSSDFGEGTQALFQLGFSVEQTQALFRLGQTDAYAFAQQVRDAAASKPFAEQQRALKLVGRQFEGQTKDLLTRQSLFDDETQARSEASDATKKSLLSFEQMTESFRKSGAQAMKVFENLMGLGKVIIGSVFGDEATKIFGSASDSLKVLNVALLNLREKMTATTGFFQQSVAPVIRVVGTAFITLSGIIGSLVGIMGTMGASSAIGKGAVDIFAKIAAKADTTSKTFTWLIGGIGNIGKAFAWVGKKILFPLAIIDSVITALRTMGAVFRDPDATGAEKFGAIIKGTFYGLLSFVDNLLLGIPSMIANNLFPDMVAKFNTGFDGLMKSITGFFSGGNLTDTIKRWIDSAIDYLGQFPAKIKDFFAGMAPSLAAIGQDVGAGFVGLLLAVFYDLPKAMNDIIIGGTWDIITGIYNIFTGSGGGGGTITEGLITAFVVAMASVGEVILGIGPFIVGFFEGMGEMLKVPFIKAGAFIEKTLITTWTYIKVGLEGAVLGMKSIFFGLIGTIAEKFKDLIDPILSVGAALAKYLGLGGVAETLQTVSTTLGTIVTGVKVWGDESKAASAATIDALLAENDKRMALIDRGAKRKEEAFNADQQRRKAELAAEKKLADDKANIGKKSTAESIADEQARQQKLLDENKSYQDALRTADAAVNKARLDATKAGGSWQQVDKAGYDETMKQLDAVEKAREAVLGKTVPATAAAVTKSDNFANYSTSPQRAQTGSMDGVGQSSAPGGDPFKFAVGGQTALFAQAVNTALTSAKIDTTPSNRANKPDGEAIYGSNAGMMTRGDVEPEKPLPSTVTAISGETARASSAGFNLDKFEEWFAAAMARIAQQEVVVKVVLSPDLIEKDRKELQSQHRRMAI